MPTVWVRYIVNDVDASIEFYSRLGFKVDMHPAPSFAALSRGDLQLLFNTPTGPGGASQPMPDGRRPEPGGWNRFMVVTRELDSLIDRLSRAGATFRGETSEAGAGRARLVEDPSGNLVELFQFKDK